MATNSAYEFHNFPKLAEESGFAFNTLRPRVHVDWNRIRSIDIESLIRDRKFSMIEQHIGDILNCALESEFDVRILDQGVVKMFRLAQLALEYHQFCRHYLDRSIHVLREEVTALVQELDNSRKGLREREEELRKLKRKAKHVYRPPLPYGNENIATMILKTLTNKTNVFPSPSELDTQAYNRCSFCDKVFLNQLYLQSHMVRRHPGMLDLPEKESQAQPTNDNAQSSTEKVDEKFYEEIMQLKSKLQEMENMIANIKQVPENKTNNAIENTKHCEGDQHPQEKVAKNTKDAEASTSNDDYLLDKIEAWKKEEHEKYNKEISLLRTQILDTINSLKEKEPQKEPSEDPNSIEQLHIIIKKQGDEIHALKQELLNSKLVLGNEEMGKRKEAEAQMQLLTQRMEIQSKQYEALLQNLNEVAREAQESRALAKTERDRARQLEERLQYHLQSKALVNNSPAIETKSSVNSKLKTPAKRFLAADSKSLQNLHRKAQELLNIGSSSSEMSSGVDENDMPPQSPKNDTESVHRLSSGSTPKEIISNKLKTPKTVKTRKKQTDVRETHQKKTISKQKENGHNNEDSTLFKNSVTRKPGSPVKLVRAKITEEVNSRLASIGIDPLKNSLPQNVFKKHRSNLQQQNDTKSKKNPNYLKVRHAILTYLDSNTSATKGNASGVQEYMSPRKTPKNFSISSLLSNVKSKAMAIVKTNETNVQTRANAFNARKAIEKDASLESTSGSDSGLSSPEMQNQNIVPEVKHPWNIKKQIKKTANNHEDLESSDSDHKYYNSAITEPTTKSIESLIKSPARRPASANAIHDNTVRNFVTANKDLNSTDTTQQHDNKNGNKDSVESLLNHDNTSDDAISSVEVPIKKAKSVDNIESIPKTKGVLKNASSASSLNKKKVLFDMDAIQMKSVSASPSQSINEKSNDNQQFELGLINLDGEDWDISSIENEPLNNDTKIKVNSRTGPKISELRQSIETQLAQRKKNNSLVGGVDVLKGPPVKAPSITGSNTSLGSSILDESDVPAVNANAFIKPKRTTDKNDSDLDISEYSIDVMVNNDKKSNDSF